MEPAKEEVHRRLRFRPIYTSSFHWTPLKKSILRAAAFAACLLTPFRHNTALLEKNYRLHINIYAALKFFTRALSCLET